MNSSETTMEAMASSSPRITTRPKAFQACRCAGSTTVTAEAATPTKNVNCPMYRPQATSRLMPVSTSPWFHWRSQSRIPAMMEATSAAIHHRYSRLPDMALARTVMRPLKKVENVRPGPQLGLAAECVARAEKLRDGGGGVGRVAENHGLGRAHLDTRRLPAARQTLGAEGALFDYAFRARGIRRIDGAQERPRVAPIEAARAVGACGHAVTAADAAVLVHHHQAIASALPGGAGGANLDARRMVAVIAEQRDGSAGDGGTGAFFTERVFETLFPDPLDFAAPVGNKGNVMGRVARLRAARAAAVFPALRQIDRHGHAARFAEGARGRGQQREKGYASDLQDRKSTRL